MTLSFTKAEFTALSEGCTAVVWLRKVLKELCRNQDATDIAQDNRGAIDWAEGGPAKQFVKRKNIDIKFNSVMKLIDDGEVKLKKVDTNKMIADYLTNPLAPGKFENVIKRAAIFPR